jgi:hypothetical protein
MGIAGALDLAIVVYEGCKRLSCQPPDPTDCYPFEYDHRWDWDLT